MIPVTFDPQIQTREWLEYERSSRGIWITRVSKSLCSWRSLLKMKGKSSTPGPCGDTLDGICAQPKRLSGFWLEQGTIHRVRSSIYKRMRLPRYQSEFLFMTSRIFDPSSQSKRSSQEGRSMLKHSIKSGVQLSRLPERAGEKNKRSWIYQNLSQTAPVYSLHG
jgi:hypothetical protein